MRKLGVVAFIVLLTALSAGGCGWGVGSPRTTTAPTAAKSAPRTIQQLCNGLTWPRRVPSVVGLILDDNGRWEVQPLTCLDGVRGIRPDGSVVYENGDYKLRSGHGFDRITAVSPPPGAIVAPHDPVTVNLAPISVAEVPTNPIDPCAWVSTTDAATILGTRVQAWPEGSISGLPGSTDVWCHYSTNGKDPAVDSELRLTASHVVDAASEFAFITSKVPDYTTSISGVGISAACAPAPPEWKMRALYVLLPGERIYVATGWADQSCDTLKQFAQAAVGRIGA